MAMRIPIVLALLALVSPTAAVPLQAVFDRAPAGGGYDRYLVLETGTVYTGGLVIGPTWDDDRQMFLVDEPGFDVRIVGNGAILDLAGQQICISFCRNRLDIEDCIVVRGGIRFRGDHSPEHDRRPVGSVRYCTFWQPDDYAVRMQGAGDGILLERNIVVDAVDTGLDYILWSGKAGEHLPTGLAFGLSIQIAQYGFPEVRDNWTWFTDPQQNADPLHHFCFL